MVECLGRLIKRGIYKVNLVWASVIKCFIGVEGGMCECQLRILLELT